MPRRSLAPPAVLAAAVLLAAASAAAQNVSRPRPPGGACAFIPVDVAKWGGKPFRNPPEIRSRGGRIDTTLVVQYTSPQQVSLAGCPLTIRSYNGELVGPTFRVQPGDVLAPRLDNRLPRETAAEVEAQYQQEAGNAFLTMRPYSFNTTNLHTHGLHVSPKDASDNVLLAIGPQTQFQYDIDLPPTHTRGAYWYHAHTHGSTAIQVGSAMAGALIVDDDPRAIPPALAAANRNEKIMVIQTILYDTAGRVNDITAFFPGPGSGVDPNCTAGSSACTWPSSGRHPTINGQIVPTITMRPGEVQRWRVIDAAFRETISLRLEKHTLYEIATDGIYTGRLDAWGPNDTLTLYPGYRTDLLVQAGARGTYRLVDDSSSTRAGLRGVGEAPNVLAVVVVAGDSVDMRLPTQAEMARLAPFPGVQLSATADGVQEAVFKLGSGLQPTDPRNSFQINYYAFDDSRRRYVELNDTDLWSLTTVGDPAAVPATNAVPALPHVFHIHVNPFQVQRAGPNGQPQWVWKDTQIIPPGDTVNVYTQYLDYTGAFVMHCHILDHEDLGMMEVVEVVEKLPVQHPPMDGRPDRRAGHHHAPQAEPAPRPPAAAGSAAPGPGAYRP